MLRIVDMREATNCNDAFAIWDTVRDCFLELNGEVCFLGRAHFIEECTDDELRERVIGLLPKWILATGGVCVMETEIVMPPEIAAVVCDALGWMFDEGQSHANAAAQAQLVAWLWTNYPQLAAEHCVTPPIG